MLSRVLIVFFGFLGIFFNFLMIYKFAFEREAMFNSMKNYGLANFKIIIFGLILFSVNELLGILSSIGIIKSDIYRVKTIFPILIIFTLGMLSSYYIYNIKRVKQ